MTVRPYFDMWCDGPGCLQWAVDATGDSKSEARKNAKRLGWTLKRGVGDLCPSCTNLYDGCQGINEVMAVARDLAYLDHPVH